MTAALMARIISRNKASHQPKEYLNMLVRFALNPYARESMARAMVSARFRLIVKSGMIKGTTCLTRFTRLLDFTPHSAPRGLRLGDAFRRLRHQRQETQGNLHDHGQVGGVDAQGIQRFENFLQAVD